jgi:hypothetical protein
LSQLGRQEWEQQKRFPLPLASALSQQFAARGLQFFKVNKAFTYVSVARPQFLDLETTPVSEGVKNIIAHINAHPKCTRRQLMETLAPSPAVIEIKPVEQPAVAPDTEPSRTTQDGTTNTAAPNAEPSRVVRDGTPNAEPTPEQTAVIVDLHWLVHQGHVIEFADGRLETAKKPAPKPPKTEKKPAEPAPTAEGEAVAPAVEPATEIITPVEEAKPVAENAPGEHVPPVEADPLEPGTTANAS